MIQGTEHWKDGIKIYIDSDNFEVPLSEYNKNIKVVLITLSTYKFTSINNGKIHYEFVDEKNSTIVRKDERDRLYFPPLRNFINGYKKEKDYTYKNLDILDGL